MFREKARKIGDDFNLIRKFPAMPGRIFDVQFSNDASRIVAGSSYNGTGHVHVFNTEDGKLVAEMKEVPSAVEKGKKIGLATMAGMLASILIGGKAAGAIMVGTQAASVQAELGYSRDDERQADQIG